MKIFSTALQKNKKQTKNKKRKKNKKKTNRNHEYA